MAAKIDHDPDQYRMSIGDHLEELRWRLILALGGFVVGLLLCLWFSDSVIVVFCAPLVKQLHSHHLSTQLYFNGLSDPFMTYLKMSIISAAAIAGPWMLFQLWQFVAAGLYPAERRVITRYIPMSVALLLGGFVFVYFLVLPLSIDFFLNFATSFPLPSTATSTDVAEVSSTQPATIPILAKDPAHPRNGDMWIDAEGGRLKVFFGGEAKVLTLGAGNLISPHITLPEYIDLVITFMITFGLCFQLPLVILALVRVGIIQVSWLREKRRIVYFVLAIFSAVVAPGDIVMSMMSLLIPLLLLYELGILLAGRGPKPTVAKTDG